MTYRVVIPGAVLDAIDAQMAYLVEQGAPPDRLTAWLASLYDLIESLDRLPRRFPVAEAVTAAQGDDVRRMNFGEYAVFFRVIDSRKVVELLAFRHGRQRPWKEAAQDSE